MAIHPLLPGMTISIDVAGKDLPEYNEEETDEANPIECVKYIEAMSGAEFGFAICFDAPSFQYAYETINLECSLDGQSVGDSWFDRQARSSRNRLVERGAISMTSQGLVSQPMLFSELTISEEAPDKSLMGKLGALGTISVVCYLARLMNYTPVDSQWSGKMSGGKKAGRRKTKAKAAIPVAGVDGELFTPLLADGRVPEKNLKGMALSHQAVVGPATPFQDTASRPVRKGSPIATFVFKYRSRAALQALHIIPRTPSPVPLEDRPVEELSIEEMRELVRRQKATLDAQNERGTKQEIKQEIKRERDLPSSEGEESDVEVVEHRNKRVRADSGHGNAESVIDLCDD
ncbi:hypothetical protein LTR56_022290 [Elasticomyces elasticus]|nr:hypothetical protein LTR56_022290 [Elasticomyces elasticus]KAK3637618.1 hypothetical protein LTR22_018181 [Elasticomyces elasticus]KAK4908688.1 hypothetical protein LTR49_022428 [Elasticomyces elasticus]KAK5748610.1 hypothetical protein LTS12_021312 [Elasticomyces elasticus]